MPALDLTLLLPVLSLALLAGWGLTAWLLMRRSSALQRACTSSSASSWSKSTPGRAGAGPVT